MKPQAFLPLYTIPATKPFAEAFVDYLTDNYGTSPQEIARMVVLLPSHRAIRLVRQAFLRATEGKAMLLPRLQALGDIEERFILRYGSLSSVRLRELQEIPNAIASLSRQIKLAQLISAYAAQSQKPMQFGHALQLAQELAELLDEMQRECCSMDIFASLVPAEFSEQWQETLDFLKIIREHWPLILSELSLQDPWERRNHLIKLLSESWKEHPPEFPVIIAGVIDPIPAVSELIQTVVSLPNGKVILQGIDRALTTETMAQMEECHPQFGILKVLEKVKLHPHQVELLPMKALYSSFSHFSEAAMVAREKWVHLAMQPASLTDQWQQEEFDLKKAVEGCHYIPCPDIRAEASVVAVLLREVLQTPGKTAALVTENRQLARYVASQMDRWGVIVDDSAGLPLLRTPIGNFLLLLLHCIASGNSPVALLALLKHPLTRLGYSAGEIRRLSRELEYYHLRGLIPSSLAVIKEKLRAEEALYKFLTKLEDALEPLAQLAVQDSTYEGDFLLNQCVAVAEILSQDDNGETLLWHGEQGREANTLLQELYSALSQVAIPFREMEGLLETVLRCSLFRSPWQGHSRLQILSPMESRMLYCDRVILGSMNEGDWPAHPEVGPWINRPMRNSMGLPSPERQTGMLAHDFSMLMALPEVFITRAEKSGGAVTVPSRFLQRLEVLLMLDSQKTDNIKWRSRIWSEWASYLDKPDNRVPAISAPQPSPPVEKRPRKLSATSIEQLLRNPYGVYAQKILRLRPLEPLQQVPQGREFGNAVHKALENFIQKEGLNTDNPYFYLLKEGEQEFAKFGDAFMVGALWIPRFEQIATWVLTQEWPKSIYCEIEGEWQFKAPAGRFTVHARMDRMDITPTGGHLIDYKTGTPPSQREIQLGLSNQLIIAALIAQQGGFGEQIKSVPIESLSYWHLTGGKKGGEVIFIRPPKNGSLQQIVEEAAEKLPELIAKFDNPAMPYLAVPDWRNKPKYNDYAHLARIYEWAYY